MSNALYFFHVACLVGNEYVLDAFILSPFHKPQAGQWWSNTSILSTAKWMSLWSCSCPASAQLTSLRLCEHLLSAVVSPGFCACFLHTGRQIRKLIDQLLSLNRYGKFKTAESIFYLGTETIYLVDALEIQLLLISRYRFIF